MDAPDCVRSEAFRRATPKSAIFAAPSAPRIKMLAGLMSRWTIRLVSRVQRIGKDRAESEDPRRVEVISLVQALLQTLPLDVFHGDVGESEGLILAAS